MNKSILNIGDTLTLQIWGRNYDTGYGYYITKCGITVQGIIKESITQIKRKIRYINDNQIVENETQDNEEQVEHYIVRTSDDILLKIRANVLESYAKYSEKEYTEILKKEIQGDIKATRSSARNTIHILEERKKEVENEVHDAIVGMQQLKNSLYEAEKEFSTISKDDWENMAFELIETGGYPYTIIGSSNHNDKYKYSSIYETINAYLKESEAMLSAQVNVKDATNKLDDFMQIYSEELDKNKVAADIDLRKTHIEYIEDYKYFLHKHLIEEVVSLEGDKE